MNGVIAPSGVPLVAHYSHFCSAAHKPFTFALLCPFWHFKYCALHDCRDRLSWAARKRHCGHEG